MQDTTTARPDGVRRAGSGAGRPGAPADPARSPDVAGGPRQPDGRRPGMTTFRCLFDNPVFGDHSPLVLGWAEDQLWPIVDRLAPFLPDNLDRRDEARRSRVSHGPS